ncbi:hypothetical protein BZA05DRAFT_394321 [Tricharina praecox]|uniref:uncharacterized protein n=1 Tax=Tricharina praecox TaxID=43433 RepID=UPI0022210268|nr:uncharacterized protein BZA05DRAFT_394321 [Tricharina praecox]KAI5854466.1 hypothetical protein BZA05DRAFT_394321 [Tricharina praecox]
MKDNMWADYPFPLISTPAVDRGYTDQFVKSSSKMALTHNVLIRGMNAMYLQCEYVTPDTTYDFLTFCQCWSEMLHNHHECEEMAYFPVIEKAVGVEGLAESNLDEHEAFMPGLRKFDDYVYNATPYNFSGQKLYQILDSFAAALQMHLTDEIVWILSLSKYKHLDLAAIDVQHGMYVKAHSSRLRLLPYLLTNHDLTYEGGIHSWWPTGNRARDMFLRYICTLWNRGAWKYSACSLGGKPRRLQGIKWDKLDDVTVETAMVELDIEIGPKPPDKAYTRISKEVPHVTHSPSESQFSSRSVTRLV